MKRALLVIAVLALMARISTVGSLGEEAKGRSKKPIKGDDEVSRLMHEKLENSQEILEGIALNDFDKIEKHAGELIILSKKAEWMVVKTPKYELFSNEFRRLAEDLIQHAKDKNLDAATLSYMEMTMNCVRCHKYVREVRQAHLDGKPSLLSFLPSGS